MIMNWVKSDEWWSLFSFMIMNYYLEQFSIERQTKTKPVTCQS